MQVRGQTRIQIGYEISSTLLTSKSRTPLMRFAVANLRQIVSLRLQPKILTCQDFGLQP
jgi:hypothetical protein